MYVQARRSSWRNYPRLLVLVTGKGRLRNAFRTRLAATDLQMVAFRLLWLEPQDYPRLLGCADLGVSLHMSSSGLDLPMKVGKPVCYMISLIAILYCTVSQNKVGKTIASE